MDNKTLKHLQYKTQLSSRMGGLSCLTILNWMVLFCCMITYMLRVNMAITIVIMPDMESPKTSINNTITNETCHDNSTSCSSDAIKITSSYNTYTPLKQNIIQASFFWGYIITEIPGGRLAEVIGSKKVIGYSTLMASLFTLLIPLTSTFTGYYGLLTVRFLEGLALGSILPSLQPLAAKWVPPMERGKFMSNILAISLGSAITYPMCGLIISWIGWPSVFYITGFLGLLWTVGWFVFIYDSPAHHPRISEEEKLSLDSAITPVKVLSVPWIKIISSRPVWAIIITHTITFMNYSTLTLQMPSFIYQVIKVDIKKIGFYSSLPQLGKYFMALLTGYITSYLLQYDKLTLMNIRRIFVFISVGIPGLLMILQAYTGYMMAWTVFNLCLSFTLSGAVSGGHFCGGLDIAPNFSGTIFGLANTLGSLASSLSTYLVGHVTSEEQTFAEWQIIFWLLGGAYIIGFINYITLGSATLQDWNMPMLDGFEKQINSNSNISSNTEIDKELKTINMYSGIEKEI